MPGPAFSCDAVRMSGPLRSGDSRSTIGMLGAALVEQRWAVRCRDLRPVAGGDETNGRPLLSISVRRGGGSRSIGSTLSSAASRSASPRRSRRSPRPMVRPSCPSETGCSRSTPSSTGRTSTGRTRSSRPPRLDSSPRFIARTHRSCSQPVRRRPPARRQICRARRTPVELVDTELDRWHAAIATSGLPRGLIHGDFYRRNLLWAHERVVAMVDRHEAHHDLIACRLA